MDPFTSIDSGFKEVDGVLMPASLLGSNAIIVSQVNVDGTLTPRPLDFSRHLPGGAVRVYIPGQRWEVEGPHVGGTTAPGSVVTTTTSGQTPGYYVTVGNWSLLPFQDDLTQEQIDALPESLSQAKRRKHPEREKLKADLENALKIDNGNGSCLTKLNALLAELRSGFKSFTNVSDSFFRGRNQIFETLERVTRVKRKVGKKWEIDPNGPAMGATTSNGRNLEITLNRGNVNPTAVFIHELLHAATGNNAGFEHPTIIAAIRRLEGRQDISIDSFIGMYCRKKEEKE